MKWVPDNIHGLVRCPHYDPNEIDEICDRQILDFLRKRHDGIRMPIPTDEIEVLLEQETEDYDAYAKLPPNVEGMTAFQKDCKPSVKISEHLGEDSRFENRRRTTITHELGHVIFHANLWVDTNSEVRCNRDNIDGTTSYDWMEWQAYYASGAYLMPISQVQLLVDEIYELGVTLDHIVDKAKDRTLKTSKTGL